MKGNRLDVLLFSLVPIEAQFGEVLCAVGDTTHDTSVQGF